MLATVFASSFSPANAQASTVQFEQSPLFNSVNFVPGDSVTKWVKLNNTTGVPHRAILRTINVSNTGDLKSVVGLVIKQDSTILYDDTFSDLFSKPEIVLPQVPANSSVQFDFTATFKTTAGDEYQNSTMGFNLQIGFEDLDVVVDDTTVSVGKQNPVGGGAGGGPIIIGPKYLVISDESINSTLPPQTNSAVVTWNTNLLSTSQVVYGLASGGPYVLNLTLDNFGYPQGTAQDLTKVTYHTVTLLGLVPEQIYSYRVISRASPPTVSYEHTFMLRKDGTIETNPTLALATPTEEQNNPVAQGEVAVPGANTFRVGEPTGNQNGEGNQASSTGVTANNNAVDNSNQAASAFFGNGVITWNTGAWIMIAILLASFLVIWRKNKKK